MSSPSPSLAAAAGATFDNLSVQWSVGFLSVVLSAFWPQVLLIFPESDDNGRPVANWGQVLACVASQIPSGVAPLLYLNQSAQIVYRLCWMASFLQTDGQITTAQANALLAAYNGTIAL